MNQNLVEILKSARLEKNLKQEEVAKVLGVKKNTISNYENGKSEPDIDSLITMCKLYGIDYAATIRKAYSEEKEKAPTSENSETEADAGGRKFTPHEIEVYNILEDTFVRLGFIEPGGDLTSEQADAMIALIKIIKLAFNPGNKKVD